MYDNLQGNDLKRAMVGWNGVPLAYVVTSNRYPTLTNGLGLKRSSKSPAIGIFSKASISLSSSLPFAITLAL